MIDPSFLEMLRCPATRQKLTVAPGELLEQVKSRLPEGAEEALVREDGVVVYPMRGGIPILLVEAAISV